MVDGVYGYVYVFDVTSRPPQAGRQHSDLRTQPEAAPSRMDHVRHRRPLRLSGRRRRHRHDRRRQIVRADSDERETDRDRPSWVGSPFAPDTR